MLNSLNNIINNDVKLYHADNVICFEEPNPDARLKKLIFRTTSFVRNGGGHINNAIVVKSDLEDEPFDRFSHYLNTECQHINKRCDYIIFHLKGTALRIIVCELKSSEIALEAGSRCYAQLDVSLAFAKYLISLAQQLFSLRDDEECTLDFTFHKIVFLPRPAVSGSVPLGAPRPIEFNTGLQGVNVLLVDTHPSTGVAQLEWVRLMEAI